MQAERVAFQDRSVPHSIQQAVCPFGTNAVEQILYQFHIASTGKNGGELLVGRLKHAKRSVVRAVDDLDVLHQRSLTALAGDDNRVVSSQSTDELQRRMADHIVLQFDWDDVAHRRVVDVLGRQARTMSDGSASWEAVAICLDGQSICLVVDPDTDQIEAILSETHPESGWEPIHSFSFAVGQPLGWCWVGINSQGYKDSFTLAFGDTVPSALQPRCMFLAEASSLTCLDLSPRLA